MIRLAAVFSFGWRSQLTDTLPPGVDSAPYFAAFVTSTGFVAGACGAAGETAKVSHT